MVVTITAYCYGLRTHTCPKRKGSFLAIFQYGGRERSIAPPSDQKTRFAVFAVRTRRCGATGRMPRQRGRVREVGKWRRCEPGCVPGSQVCTQAKRKTARIENSTLARVCSRFAGWVAEIGPRAFAHGLTHRTQLHVTLYTRARACASREVTTTCVRCVRHAGISARAFRNWTPLAADQTTRYTRSPLSL